MTGRNNVERNRAIVEKYKAGVRQSDIAKEFNISRQCVFKLVNKYKDKFGNPIYERLLETNSACIADREFNRYKENPALIDELLMQEKQVSNFGRKEKEQEKNIKKLKEEHKKEEKSKSLKEFAQIKKDVRRAERKTEIWKDVLNDYDLLTKSKN